MQPTQTCSGNGNQIGAIVTGADYRGLGVVRSLGRRGVPVVLLKQSDHSLAACSRYARRCLPWPVVDDAGLVDFLINLADNEGLKGWVLIPTDDILVGLLARHHESLSQHFLLTVPPWEDVRWACDKRQLNKLAADVHVDHPWTLYPGSREELVKLDCPFPVIIKPAMRETFNRLTVDKAWRVDDRDSLLARYDDARTMISPDLIMIQECIPGWGETQFSYAALCRDGVALAAVVARRIRQFPMEFGRFSTYVETMDDPGIVELAVRLLKVSRYTGLVEVEFKRDPRDGRLKVLDANPRVWGWHTLGARAGVDFSYLLWRMARGEQVPEAHGKAGVCWMRGSTDVLVALLEILRGRLAPGDYIRCLHGPVESATFAVDDPVPGILEVPEVLYMSCKRLFQRA